MGDGVSRDCECANCVRLRNNTRVPTSADLVVLSKEDWRLISKWSRIQGYRDLGDKIPDPVQCLSCKVVFDVYDKPKKKHNKDCEVARAEDIMRRLGTI